MKTVSYVDRIVSQDPVIHLNCRAHQILALLYSRNADVDLLYCSAFFDTGRIYDHVYRKGLYRWSYEYDYVEQRALSILGVSVRRYGTLPFDDFYALARGAIAHDDALSFFAPRSQIPYQSDYLRAMGVPVEGFLPHSFLLCGAARSSGDLLIRDDATLNHEFANFTVDDETITKGYETSPSEWFADVTMVEMSTSESCVDLAERIYIDTLDLNRDDHELYDVLRDAIPTELQRLPHLFAASGLNALSMIAGSRLLFGRFLKRTTHSAEAKALARGTVRTACAMLDAVTNLYAKPDPIAMGLVQRGLAELRNKDEVLLRQLKDECAAARSAHARIVTERQTGMPPAGSLQYGGR
ncbi:hypothetical protein AB1286_03520 [Trinickia sp. NRRL B-1857]|uniref:hypothetical protein n=1 Tax=Trinickia sp. NRRL B-1857 TaxID=3162879 RepID=UPI003D2B9E1F